MDKEIKVSLTIALPGSVMLSKEECLKTTQKEIEKKTKAGKIYKKIINIQVEDWDKMNSHTMRVTESKKSNPKTITFHTRKSKQATQSINICKEAYDYMTSEVCPSWSNNKKWKLIKSEQRLKAHLSRIAESLGGYMLSYKVFED